MEQSANLNSSVKMSNKIENAPGSQEVGERKNFLKPQFENPLEKREKFAVTLRKKKTQEIVRAKRRKIIDNLTKSKKHSSDINALEKVSELTVEQMELQFYQGYPLWRKDEYKGQQQILSQILNQSDYAKFQQNPSTHKILYILNVLNTNQKLEPIQQLALITKVRQEMATKDCPSNIKEILAQTSVLTVISQILSLNDNQDHLVRYMKLEATWILTNIGYGDEQDLMKIFDKKYSIYSHINSILEGNDLQLIDQCVWLCANAAGESDTLRNMILTETNIIDNMSRIISQVQATKSKNQIMKALLPDIMWCCSNLTRKASQQPNSNQHIVSVTISSEQKQKLLYIIRTFMDCEEMSLSMQDALWALSYLMQDCDDHFITQVCQGNTTIQNLIQYMKSDLSEEYTPSLRAIGNILSSDVPQNIDLFIFHGGLDAINQMMTENQQIQIMKECMWGLSNITAGTEQQISAFTKHSELFEKVFILGDSKIMQIRREALFILTNLILSTKENDLIMKVTQFQNYSIIRLFCQGLSSINDISIVFEILQALEVVLELDQKYGLKGENSIAYKIENVGGLEQLEQLQKHPNISIYNQVETIIKKFYEEEEGGQVLDSDMDLNQQFQENGNSNNKMFRI